ncbi:MAG: DUF4230 domain-containing protein [Anaerolineae bacterium]|nr:DUF4230 domain-containing protein [Anaerolineae bacterium]
MQQSRIALNFLIIVVVIAGLVGLAIWLAPQIVRWLNPGYDSPTALEQVESYLHPTPTIRPNPATIIRQVRALSRLETASYTIEKVITAESGQDALAFLFGDRLLLVAHGQVIAGVDLGQIQEGDITVTADDRVVVVLPPAEIFLVTLDNDKTYVYDRDTGMFGMNPGLESAARQAAEAEILLAALEDGILEKAEENARAYLEQLITSFGFQEVIFVQATPTPTPPPQPVTIVPATP